MIYSLSGKLDFKRQGFVVVEAGGVGYKIFVSSKVAHSLPQIGSEVKLFTYFYTREDSTELYGFIEEKELGFFSKLISISGVGPKTALGILAVSSIDQLAAAINTGKTDLLTKVSGIGKKTAERIILELKGKVEGIASEETAAQMESDMDIEDALVALGYTKQQSRTAISHIDPKITNFEDKAPNVRYLLGIKLAPVFSDSPVLSPVLGKQGRLVRSGNLKRRRHSFSNAVDS